jgi:hypothetical protein
LSFLPKYGNNGTRGVQKMVRGWLEKKGLPRMHGFEKIRLFEEWIGEKVWYLPAPGVVFG